MRVLLATGNIKLNKTIRQAFPGDWQENPCGHRGIVVSVADEIKPDVIVLAEGLDGNTPFPKLMESLWLKGYRVILLPGEPDIPPTVTLMREAVKYNVYDFVTNPVTGDKVVDRILHPTVPADIERELRLQAVQADDLSKKVVPDSVEKPKQKKSLFGGLKVPKLPQKEKLAPPPVQMKEPEPARVEEAAQPAPEKPKPVAEPTPTSRGVDDLFQLPKGDEWFQPEPEQPPLAKVKPVQAAPKPVEPVPPEPEGLNVVVDQEEFEVRPATDVTPISAATLSGLIAVVSPWMARSDPAIMSVVLSEYLAGLGRKVALVDPTGTVKQYLPTAPGTHGKADVWLYGAATIQQAEAVVTNFGEAPEEVPAEVGTKLLALGRPPFVSDFALRRWADKSLKNFRVLSDSQDGDLDLRIPRVNFPALDARYFGVLARLRKEPHQEQPARRVRPEPDRPPEPKRQPPARRRPRKSHGAELRDAAKAAGEGYQAVMSAIGYLISLPGLVLDFLTGNLYRLYNLAVVVLIYATAAYLLSTFGHVHLPGWQFMDRLAAKWGIV